MIGRADDVREIAVQLEQGTNLILASPRRTGKTTVCGAALDRLQPARTYVVRLDLRFIADIGQLAETLVERSFANRPALYRAWFQAKHTGRELVESLGLSYAAKSGGLDIEGLELNLLPQIRKDPIRYLDYALTLPERIASADNRQLVLFLDEFQEVERIGDNVEAGWAMTLKGKMRSAFESSGSCSFLFAGSLEHMLRVLFGRDEEPFAHFGSFYNLHSILPQEWEQGLRGRFQRDGTEIDDDALTRIIERGDGHPRVTMLLAQKAHLLSVIGGRMRIDLPLAEAAYTEALVSERPKHEDRVHDLNELGGRPVKRLALRVVVTVARAGRPYTTSTNKRDVTRTLEALRNAGYIEQRSRGEWRISDPLFAAYLAQLDLPGAS
jgi:hypothetical protein